MRDRQGRVTAGELVASAHRTTPTMSECRSAEISRTEPRRDGRRLHLPRGWRHEESKPVLGRGAGTCGPDGSGAHAGACLTSGGHPGDHRQPASRCGTRRLLPRHHRRRRKVDADTVVHREGGARCGVCGKALLKKVQRLGRRSETPSQARPRRARWSTRREAWRTRAGLVSCRERVACDPPAHAPAAPHPTQGRPELAGMPVLMWKHRKADQAHGVGSHHRPVLRRRSRIHRGSPGFSQMRLSTIRPFTARRA